MANKKSNLKKTILVSVCSVIIIFAASIKVFADGDPGVAITAETDQEYAAWAVKDCGINFSKTNTNSYSVNEHHTLDSQDKNARLHLMSDSLKNKEKWESVGFLNDKYLNVGGWQEKQFEPDVKFGGNDGVVHCRTALKNFSKKLNIPMSEIMCGKNGRDGILIASDAGPDSKDGKATPCLSRNYFNFNDKAEENLKKMYEAHKGKDAPNWDDLGNFSNGRKYARMYKDMEEYCGKEGKEYDLFGPEYKNKTPDPNVDFGYKDGVYLREILSDGTEKVRYYRDNSGALNRTFPTMSDNGEVKQTTCKEIFNDLNAEADNYLKALTAKGLATKGSGTVPGGDAGGNKQEDKDKEKNQKTCYTKTGPLGWVLCPLTNAAADVIQSLYQNFIEPFLVIDPRLLSDGAQKGQQASGHSVKMMWDSIRDIANIAFAFVFLAVIFSQLTGVGIDNYGIKKILPKLIVGAILINASFLISQLSIDVANIAGGGIKKLFITQATKIDEEFDIIPDSENGGFLKTDTGSGTFMLVTAAVVAVLAKPIALAFGWSLVIPVLLAFLSLLIMALTLFIILGIRSSLAVVMVVASPIAFACMILPNTKFIFDKWLKVFTAMLLTYPIASAVVYGGDLIARIVLRTNQGLGSLALTLSALVISIFPVVMLPTIIAMSLKGFGGLGGALAKLGSNARGAVGGKARVKLEGSRLNDRRKAYAGQKDLAREARRAEFARKQAESTLDRGVPKKHIPGAVANLPIIGGMMRTKDIAGMGRAGQRSYAQAGQIVSNFNREQEKMYSESFEGKDANDIMSQMEAQASTGKLDANMMRAAISAVGDQDEGRLLDLMHRVSQMSGWKRMDHNAQSSIANALRARKGTSGAAAAIGKALASDQGVSRTLSNGTTVNERSSLGDMIDNGSVGQYLREMGDSAVFDKDMVGRLAQDGNADEGGIASKLRDAMSDGQFAGVINNAQSGKSASNAIKLMETEAATGRVGRIVSAMEASTPEGAVNRLDEVATAGHDLVGRFAPDNNMKAAEIAANRKKLTQASRSPELDSRISEEKRRTYGL